jgi:hypothetical protein
VHVAQRCFRCRGLRHVPGMLTRDKKGRYAAN